MVQSPIPPRGGTVPTKGGRFQEGGGAGYLWAMFEETQKDSESSVQKCCSLRPREVWLRHCNFSAVFLHFPHNFPAVFRNFSLLDLTRPNRNPPPPAIYPCTPNGGTPVACLKKNFGPFGRFVCSLCVWPLLILQLGQVARVCVPLRTVLHLRPLNMHDFTPLGLKTAAEYPQKN